MGRHSMARRVKQQPVLSPPSIWNLEMFAGRAQDFVKLRVNLAALSKNVNSLPWLSLLNERDQRRNQRDLLKVGRLGLIDQDIPAFPRNVHPPPAPAPAMPSAH